MTSEPYQRKRPISHEVEKRARRMAVDPTYADSFFSKVGKQHTIELMKEYKGVIEENKRLKSSPKFSAGVLTTCTYEEKKDVIEKLNKKSEMVSTVLPVSSVLGAKADPLKTRKVKQLDEIEFENDESEEDEDTYEYKVRRD